MARLFCFRRHRVKTTRLLLTIIDLDNHLKYGLEYLP